MAEYMEKVTNRSAEKLKIIPGTQKRDKSELSEPEEVPHKNYSL